MDRVLRHRFRASFAAWYLQLARGVEREGTVCFLSITTGISTAVRYVREGYLLGTSPLGGNASLISEANNHSDKLGEPLRPLTGWFCTQRRWQHRVSVLLLGLSTLATGEDPELEPPAREDQSSKITFHL